VELLVVFYVLTVLMALLLVAVQSARETARRTTCQNNLRQIAIGYALHENSLRHWPSGGWGWRWVGDPDRGFGIQQPGGWAFNILPFVERQSLRDMGRGMPAPGKRAQGCAMVQIPLEFFYCPSRRPVGPYPFVHPTGFVNIDPPPMAARSDYAANAGDTAPGLYGPGPNSLAEGDSPGYPWPKDSFTGICFRRSLIGPQDVLDGLSNTYLLAEGFLDPDHYTSGTATNDDQGMYAGSDRDTLRVTHPKYPPLPDSPGVQSDHSFGSAHPSGFHAAMCDGSVRPVTYTIDSEAHRRLGNRHDRLPVNPSGP
jgi:hypothetical protein